MKRKGKLHDLHIRIPEEDYERVQEVCKKLNITIADYFNQLLKSDGYDKLIGYAKVIKDDPRPIEIRFANDEDKERMDRLTEALNYAAAQTRKAGVNISNLIRDIRSGKVSFTEAQEPLARIERTLKLQTKAYQQSGEKLSDLLFSENGIQKVEKETVVKKEVEQVWW